MNSSSPLTATIDPRADLHEVITATDTVAADLNTVLGRDDARARILLSVARRTRTQQATSVSADFRMRSSRQRLR